MILSLSLSLSWMYRHRFYMSIYPALEGGPESNLRRFRIVGKQHLRHLVTSPNLRLCPLWCLTRGCDEGAAVAVSFSFALFSPIVNRRSTDCSSAPVEVISSPVRSTTVWRVPSGLIIDVRSVRVTALPFSIVVVVDVDCIVPPDPAAPPVLALLL